MVVLNQDQTPKLATAGGRAVRGRRLLSRSGRGRRGLTRGAAAPVPPGTASILVSPSPRATTATATSPVVPVAAIDAPLSESLHVLPLLLTAPLAAARPLPAAPGPILGFARNIVEERARLVVGLLVSRLLAGILFHGLIVGWARDITSGRGSNGLFNKIALVELGVGLGKVEVGVGDLNLWRPTTPATAATATGVPGALGVHPHLINPLGQVIHGRPVLDRDSLSLNGVCLNGVGASLHLGHRHSNSSLRRFGRILNARPGSRLASGSHPGRNASGHREGLGDSRDHRSDTVVLGTPGDSLSPGGCNLLAGWLGSGRVGFRLRRLRLDGGLGLGATLTERLGLSGGLRSLCESRLRRPRGRASRGWRLPRLRSRRSNGGLPRL